jgi:hypothetical protein
MYSTQWCLPPFDLHSLQTIFRSSFHLTHLHTYICTMFLQKGSKYMDFGTISRSFVFASTIVFVSCGNVCDNLFETLFWKLLFQLLFWNVQNNKFGKNGKPTFLREWENNHFRFNLILYKKKGTEKSEFSCVFIQNKLIMGDLSSVSAHNEW